MPLTDVEICVRYCRVISEGQPTRGCGPAVADTKWQAQLTDSYRGWLYVDPCYDDLTSGTILFISNSNDVVNYTSKRKDSVDILIHDVFDTLSDALSVAKLYPLETGLPIKIVSILEARRSSDNLPITMPMGIMGTHRIEWRDNASLSGVLLRYCAAMNTQGFVRCSNGALLRATYPGFLRLLLASHKCNWGKSMSVRRKKRLLATLQSAQRRELTKNARTTK